MPLLDVVDFIDNTGKVLAARVPPDGNGELRLGSQCTVREGQLAFFSRDGVLLDMLVPGRHTLTSNNIPLLIDYIKLPFGNRSPFRADVLFVSLHQHTDLRWGTSQPIPMRDAQLGIVRLRAFGTYVIQVAQPRQFLTGVVGTRSRFLVEDIENQLRSSILSRIADTVAEHMREQKLSVLDLATEYDEIAERTREKLRPDFAALGLELVRFYVNTISVPEAVEQQMDKAGGVSVMGGLGDYTRFQAAEALRDAARSGGEGTVGAGIGLGAGMQLGQLLGSSLNPAATPQTPPAPPAAATPAAATLACPKCQAANPAHAKFCNNCGTRMAPATCPSCQASVAPGAKFCIECGTALSTS